MLRKKQNNSIHLASTQLPASEMLSLCSVLQELNLSGVTLDYTPSAWGVCGVCVCVGGGGHALVEAVHAEGASLSQTLHMHCETFQSQHEKAYAVGRIVRLYI